MFNSNDYMLQVEGWHYNGILGLTELEAIADKKEATTSKGKIVVDWIQQDKITLDQIKGLAVQIDACTTAQIEGMA